jgi:hypothetical protein
VKAILLSGEINVKVVVLVKQTPDTAELPKVSADEVRSGEVKVDQTKLSRRD